MFHCAAAIWDFSGKTIWTLSKCDYLIHILIWVLYHKVKSNSGPVFIKLKVSNSLTIYGLLSPKLVRFVTPFITG